MKKKFLILFLFYFFLHQSSSYANEIIYIATASNFSKTLEKIAELFKQENPGTEIKITSGASGIIANQIIQGAPFHLFFSADKKYIKFLKDKNKIVQNSNFIFSIGKLVFWMPKKNIDTLSESDIKKMIYNIKAPIAVADQKTTPFGAATREFLDHFLIDEKMKHPKFIFGRSIEHVAHYVYSGFTECGFVSLSSVVHVNGSNKEHYWVVPQKYYSPLIQEAAIINQDKNLNLVHKFVIFFKNKKEVKAIIAQSGYSI